MYIPLAVPWGGIPHPGKKSTSIHFLSYISLETSDERRAATQVRGIQKKTVNC